MGEDRVVELLERECEWLRAQVENLQAQIINLSDPFALARVQATQPRPEKRPVPTRPGAVDRMSDDELAALKVAMAMEEEAAMPALSPTREAIEKEFVEGQP